MSFGVHQIWCCRGVDCRHGLALVLLQLWCRLAAAAPIRPLAWEPPYAKGGALKKQHKKQRILESTS